MNDKITFEGFEPNSEFVSQAKNFLWRVEETSPGNSSPVANIKKTEAGYRAQVLVTSLAGKFEAETESDNLDHLLEGLFENLSLKLSDWKDSRSS